MMECKITVKGGSDKVILLSVKLYYETGEKIHDAIVKVRKIINLKEELIAYGKTNPRGCIECKIKDIKSSYKISIYEEEIHMKKLKVLSAIVKNIDDEKIEVSVIARKE